MTQQKTPESSSNALDTDLSKQCETASSDANGKPTSAPHPTVEKVPCIIGMGASAGGLKALQTFFNNMPSDSGLAFVVLQHLSPDYKSMMVELLSKNTEMTVCRVENRMTVRPNHVYLLPPRNNMTIYKGQLFLTDLVERHGLNLPIDIFFYSLAEDQGDKAIGIILSGTGSDGTKGLRAIKGEGGMVMVQAEESADFDGMPKYAIATGLSDFILPPERMPEELLKFINHPVVSSIREPGTDSHHEEDSFTTLFSMLKKRVKVDFQEYKPATVIRRVERRLGIVHAPDLPEYIHHVRQHPGELDLLFKDLLIGVTRFFRDTKAFEAFNENVIPRIFEQAQREKRDYIRGWVVGCSTGEEAYSLAMMLHNYMKEHRLQSQIKIFATDIDKSAVEYAGAGFYPDSVVTDIDLKYLSQYFDKKEGGYQVKREIRELVVFALQNIANDPPFTKLDFISCRNILIYLKPQLQKKIFSMFNYVLNTGAYLFLGNSETVGDEMAEAFEGVDLKNRLFRHTTKGTLPAAKTLLPIISNRTRVVSAAQAAYENRINTSSIRTTFRDTRESYYQSLINKTVQTLLVIDENRELVQTYGAPGKYLELPLGNASFDLIAMLPRELALAISSAIQKVRKDNHKVCYPAIKIHRNGLSTKVDLIVDTLPDYGVRQNLFMILINDVSETPSVPEGGNEALTDSKNSQDSEETLRSVGVPDGTQEIKGFTEKQTGDRDGLPDSLANERIMDLERELQFTRENLQATIEELQTANEELQATNEELLAANEEMQSTNEELQSVNEELNTVNAEYQSKVIELTETNDDMNNLMSSSDTATIFLDSELRIRKFTPSITGLINIMEIDTGRPLTDLNINIFGNIRRQANKVMETGVVFEKSIQYRNQWFLERILPFYNEKKQIDGVVLNLVDITAQKKTELTLKTQHSQLKSILEISPVALFTVLADGKIQYANRHAEEITGVKKSVLTKMKINAARLGITDLDGKPIKASRMPLALIMERGEKVENYLLGLVRPDQTRIIVRVTGEPLLDPDGNVVGAVFRYDQVAYEKITPSSQEESFNA